MPVTQAGPDFDLVWRTKVVDFGGSSDRPLDGLPQPTAAWWPGWQLLSTYSAALLSAANADGSPSGDVGIGTTGQVLAAAIAAAGASQSQFLIQLFDQSGNARPLTAASVAAAPKIYDQATARYEQQNLSLAPLFAAPRTMSRSDALGLASDPALTLAWKARFTTIVPPSAAPNIIALGDALAPELCLFGNTTIAPADVIGLTDFDGVLGGTWTLPVNTLDTLHSYVLTKPAGSGYDASAWTLSIDGSDVGPATVNMPGPLALGTQLTQLSDVPGGGFPFDGSLAGFIVWAEVLDPIALAQLQAFLDSV